VQRYVIRRIVLSIPTLFGVSVVVFTLIRLLPGDVVSLMAGDFGAASQATRDAIMAEFHLDQNIPRQYLEWIGHILRGDLGASLISGRDVSSEVARRLPISFQLGAMALVFSVALGVPIGLLSAVRQNSKGDYLGRSVAIGFLAAPNFWIALLLISLAGRYFHFMVPPTNYVGFSEDPVSSFKFLLMPALLTGASHSGALMRYARTAMLEEMRRDYIRTARSKGLGERSVITRHGLRNALIPIVTVIGLGIPGIITGSIIMEQVYSIPGMGRYYLQSLNNLDFPVIQGIFLLYGIAVVFVNLAVDIMYSWINPRIRYS
jgi:peptide/nickel transport system permease protein